MENILAKIKKIITLRLIIGLAIGGLLGFAYYYFIGCNGGTCPITSNPYKSTLWGMAIGGLLFYKKST
jgi:Family of unknown function (DUF6132)